jgi:hypothetical protein
MSTKEILQQIHDEADHIVGSSFCFSSAFADAKAIKRLAKKALKELDTTTQPIKIHKRSTNTMKRTNVILLQISGDSPDRNVCVTCTQQAKGYYLGELSVLGRPYHVEAIQLGSLSRPVNDNYQNRIDRFTETNEGGIPHTVKIGRRVFFVNIESYAQ